MPKPQKSKPIVDLMLDSGAFTAWTKGEHINLNDYINYCKRNKHLLFAYVNLDEIPGKKGTMTRDPDSVEKSARTSYENLQRMKDAGLRPIPVFHQGEKFSWLERLLDDGEDYIGISPFRVSPRRDIVRWLDECFSRLCDQKGRPIVKTHGFGTTSPVYIFGYPWYSMDSTTWALGAGYGLGIFPCLTADGKDFDFNRPPLRISVTGMSKISRVANALSVAHQNAISKFLDTIGYTLKDMERDHDVRARVQLTYFRELERRMRVPRFTRRQSRFVDAPRPVKAIGTDHQLRIFFSASVHAIAQSNTLTEIGLRNRLLSYWWMRKYSDEELERYIYEGVVKRSDNPRTIRRTSKYRQPRSRGYFFSNTE